MEKNRKIHTYNRVTLLYTAQMVKNPPAMQETWVQFLGWEDPQEKGMATHCSILAWRIPWIEEPGGATVHGVTKSQTQLSNFTFYFIVFSIKGEGIRNKEVIHS